MNIDIVFKKNSKSRVHVSSTVSILFTHIAVKSGPTWINENLETKYIATSNKIKLAT